MSEETGGVTVQKLDESSEGASPVANEGGQGIDPGDAGGDPGQGSFSEGDFLDKLRETNPAFSDVRSLEDLNGFARFASPEMAAANQFAADTGGDPFEFFRLQQLDFDSMSDEDIIKMGMRSDYPEDVEDAKIELAYRKRFGQKNLDEDLDDEDMTRIKEENDLTDLERIREAQRYREKFSQYKQEYSSGKYASRKVDFLEHTSSEQAQAELSEYIPEAFNFDLNGNRIGMQLDGELMKDFSPQTPKDFLANFINEDGSFNQQEFVGMQLLFNKFEDIVGKLIGNERAMTSLDLVANFKGRGQGSQGGSQGDPQVTSGGDVIRTGMFDDKV